MGKFYKLLNHSLLCVCAATASFQALATGEVQVGSNPTTTYKEVKNSTFKKPQNARITGLPSTEKAAFVDNQMRQKMPAGIEINAIKSGASGSTDFTATLKSGLSATRNAAARCLTSFRCNMALAAGATGIQALLDGVDWVMTEGAQPVFLKPGDTCDECNLEADLSLADIYRAPCNWYDNGQNPNNCTGMTVVKVSSTPYGTDFMYCPPTHNNGQLLGFSPWNTCAYSLSSAPPVDPDWYKSPPEPATNSEIKDLFDSYIPHPDDWGFIAPGLDLSAPDVELEIDDIPSIESEPIITSSPDGTTTVEISGWDFTLSDNPSKQPEIRAQETSITTVYNEYGDVISQSSSSVNIGGSQAPQVDIPTDCDFMPTVCRFIEWFTEPDPETAEEPDISQLMEEYDPEGGFDFGFENAACPEPYQINFSMFPSVSISYQPICDVADIARPLIIALAYIFSGLLLIRNI